MRRLFLTACMLVLAAMSLLVDAAALEENAERKSQNQFLFTTAALSSEENENKSASVALYTEDGDLSEITISPRSSDTWEIAGMDGAYDCVLEESCLTWQYSGTDLCYIAFELDLSAEKDENCIPALSYMTSSMSGKYEVYLTEAFKITDEVRITEQVDVSERIGILDACGANESIKNKFFPRKTISSGVYYLILVPVGNEECSVSGTLKLCSFTLLGDISEKEVGKIINSETGKLTYNINYSTVSSGLTADEIKLNLTEVNWKDNTIDLNLTDAYAIEVDEINNRRSSTHGLSEFGIYSTIRVQSYDNELSERSIIPIRVYIPYPGKYRLSVLNNFANGSVYMNTMESSAGHMMFTKVYFGSARDVFSPDEIAQNINEFSYLGWYNSKAAGKSEINTVTVPVAGEYYILFIADPESLTMNPYINGGKTATNTTAEENDYQYFLMSGIELEPVMNDDAVAAQLSYDETVNVDVGNEEAENSGLMYSAVYAVASDMEGNPLSGGVILPQTEMEIGSKYTVTAPAIPGYEFFCWKSGLGADGGMVSAQSDYTFTVTSGGLALTAIYACKENDIAVYYNGNGQVIGVDKDEYVLPELPSVIGYGNSTHWTLYGSDRIFMPGETGSIDGVMYFVAQCGEAIDIEVSVPDFCTINGSTRYGESVTATAPQKKDALLFNYWKSGDGEILSFESSYTFTAMYDVELIPVYAEYIPEPVGIRKMVMKTIDKQVMVQFIGFENAIERGVLFGENATLTNYTLKKTMTTENSCYTITNDTDLPVRAYALLSDKTVVYSD